MLHASNTILRGLLRHITAATMLSQGIPREKVSQVQSHSNAPVTFSTSGRHLREHMLDAVNVLDLTSLTSG
ncbi:hypothetical protein CVM50_15415 [Pseudooceanicola marinus]|nr:hypothetical protein CVM50_15415 [Pseudooceanicola marinus]